MSSESRLRFNSVVEAQVYIVDVVATDESHKIRETWELVKWPAHDEWDVHLLGTEPD